MNTRPALEPSNSPLALSASFNKDATCFSVGLDSGFCGMFSLSELNSKADHYAVFNTDPCKLRASRGTYDRVYTLKSSLT